MKFTLALWGTVLMLSGTAIADDLGVRMAPDANGLFVYSDDLTTQRFLKDSLVAQLSAEDWAPGRISNAGPKSGRTLTYRFHADRVVKDIEVSVAQRAKWRSLAGSNALLVSRNGLDWTQVAGSGGQEADATGWQSNPLTLSAEDAKKLAGGTEFWVRVVLHNGSGLKTGTSNSIHGIQVKASLGGKPSNTSDPQTDKRASWDKLRKTSGWKTVEIDSSDASGKRTPHYCEDSDGLLCGRKESPNLAPDESAGFLIQRDYHDNVKLPLSLAAFVQFEAASTPVLASVAVRSDRDSSRRMQVFWDGKLVREFDIASYFAKDQTYTVEMPGPQEAGIHEVRVAGADSGKILVRRIAVEGGGNLRWTPKPTLPAGGSLGVLSAYYMADPLPPARSQTVEGRPNDDKSMVDNAMEGKAQQPGTGIEVSGLQRLYKEHAEFGGVRVVVRNNSTVPVRIVGDLLLNGKPITESYVDFVKSEWDARGVVWYRVRPRLMQPGESGQIYVRFRRRPAGDSMTLGIPIENGKPVDVTIPYETPSVAIDYVTVGKSMEDIFIYVRKSGAKVDSVSGITLDGVPLKGVRAYGSGFYGDVALFTAKLSKPLKLGDYHVIGVTDASAKTVAAQFRVQRFLFPKSSIHIVPEICNAMHMNLQMWNPVSNESCEKYGIYTLASSVFDVQPRAIYLLGPDEPDAHDNRGGGYGNGLGAHARRLAETGWHELIERNAPWVASWLIMNGTTRPLNWFVYGQFADITCFDPYPVTYYNADHAYVRESLAMARQSGMPNRMFACLEAYGWSSGQGVPSDARGPIPAEYRQNAVQAIGEGMKGLTSWVYSASAGGWAHNPEFAAEVKNLNRLIEHVEDYLLIGTPVYGVATSDAGTVKTGAAGAEVFPKDRVAVGSLLCGPDTIVITASNHIAASRPKPPQIVPAKNVTLTVHLPAGVRNVKASEVTEGGLLPFGCTIREGKCLLMVDSLESGRVFLLKCEK